MDLNAEATGFEFVFDSYCVERTESEEEYGSWSAAYSNNLAQVNITSELPDLVSSLSFIPGDTVYVVWCEWSEGDSFGTAFKVSVEGIGIFKDSRSAYQLSSWIYDVGNKDASSEDNLVLTTDDGQVFNFASSIPWSGYFENFENVHIDEMVL